MVLPDASIFASGGLDEYAIAVLVASGAPIGTYGVGTKMGVSADAPYLDSAYKPAAYDGRFVMKRTGGRLIARYSDVAGRPGGGGDTPGGPHGRTSRSCGFLVPHQTEWTTPGTFAPGGSGRMH